jgi:hypothetical protein
MGPDHEVGNDDFKCCNAIAAIPSIPASLSLGPERWEIRQIQIPRIQTPVSLTSAQDAQSNRSGQNWSISDASIVRSGVSSKSLLL